MKAAELLDAAKQRLLLKSDYALAKAIDINKGWIPAIRRGERAVPLDVAYRLAITLERDPAQVIAELEAEREKNERRAAFWRSFLSRAAQLAGVACTLALLSFGGSGSTQAASGGPERNSNNPRFGQRRGLMTA